MNKILVSIFISVGLLIAAGLITDNVSHANTYSFCEDPAPGDLQDWHGGTDTFLVGYYMNTVQIKNTTENCVFKVGIASYKAFEHYEDNVFSQEFYAKQTHILYPGKKWEYTIGIPDCTFQVDVFWGNPIYKFEKPDMTYSGQGRFLDGWYFPGNEEQKGKLPVCEKKPTPTPTPTPTVTVTPTPTPSSTPTPKVTPTPCPSGTIRDGDKCGQVKGSTPTPTPEKPTKLPETGPGAAIVVSMVGVVGSLLGKKYLNR